MHGPWRPQLITGFSGNPLDRADLRRSEASLFETDLSNSETRIMALNHEGLIATMEQGGLTWLRTDQFAPKAMATTIFLGLEEGAPRWAIIWQKDELEPPMRWRELRSATMKGHLSAEESAIAAQAKSMTGWHLSHKFCSQCGAPSDLVKAGYERRCPNCNASHFPRTDPVVIMLALHGDKALVGRGHHLPPNLYSALAGFMEPGETIEEAVQRELWEETGVKAHNVRYLASQPWPWPSSLMMACFAHVDDPELTIDETEIADARWISKEEAREALAGKNAEFFLPPPLAIAHQLIQHWLDMD